jgi:hypothetical protein
MWYPQKAALRVGNVSGSQWDKDNIGINSLGIGYNAIATGDFTTSLGYENWAAGAFATSLGSQTSASGTASTSMGSLTFARGNLSTAMGFQTIARSYGSISMGLYNDTIAGSLLSGQTSSDMLFSLGNGNSIKRNNALTVLYNGNVGIDTIKPQTKLHIVRSAVPDAKYITTHELMIEDRTSTGIDLITDSDGSASIYSGTELTSTRSGIIFLSDSSVSIRAGGNLTRIFVDNNGFTGIGTQTPSQRLHVVGNVLATGSFTGNAFITSSDIRYKDHIKQLENPISKINAIRGVTYKLRANAFPEKEFPNTPQVGVIAQEVEAVLPEVVVTDEKGFKAVDYSKIVPLLIEGIKEQQKMLEKQQELLEKQQTDIIQLKKIIDGRKVN